MTIRPSKNVKDGFINYAEVEYISDEDFNEINKRSKVAINDILMGMIGTIGNMALIRIEPDFAIKNVALIKNTGQINHLYLYHFLHSPYIKKQLFAVMDGGTQKFISLNNVRNLNILSPKLKEQIELGIYFENLEKIITLYQRKLDQLKKLKKYFLQNLFPAKGEKVPRIRFKGFTGDWEQRKLGECCREFKSGSFISASDIKESGEYPVFGGNGLRGYTSEYNHNGEFALIGRQGNLCGNMNYSTGKAYFTEHAIAVQANKFSDTKFMYYLLKKMNLGQYSDQSAQPGLAVGKLINMKASFPSASEQEKIGAYFANIDHLIPLHQRKLNQLQTMKKFMLQNLFI